jgi:hypothetical protein
MSYPVPMILSAVCLISLTLGSGAFAQGIVLPVQGTWGVLQGPSCPDPGNHHCGFPAQIFAYDFVPLAPSGQPANCVGQPLFSPTAGIVIGVLDVYPNSPAPGQHMAGNHIIIQRNPNEFVIMAHLTSGIPVRQGMAIHPGQSIGQCGFNGNSNIPHLHINMQASPNPMEFQASGLPMIFDNARVFLVGRGCQAFGHAVLPKGSVLC